MDECSICMEKFTSECEITPLPCDIKHYFHTGCIQSWFEQSSSCPLCKAEITKEEMEELEKKLESEIPNK